MAATGPLVDLRAQAAARAIRAAHQEPATKAKDRMAELRDRGAVRLARRARVSQIRCRPHLAFPAWASRGAVMQGQSVARRVVADKAAIKAATVMQTAM